MNLVRRPYVRTITCCANLELTATDERVLIKGRAWLNREGHIVCSTCRAKLPVPDGAEVVWRGQLTDEEYVLDPAYVSV